MNSFQSNNKRIAKNTLLLYFRMLLSLCVGLYTSRVVLQTLGVEDYGIYNVVGGAVSLFSFLNASMSGATSRFLAYEMGTGNKEKLHLVFGAALTVHIGIAIVMILLVETVGLWFLNTHLNIPETRMTAAHWVFHLSVLSMAVSVTQVPYNASLIAHEKMDIYAYVELLNVFLRLFIVFVLVAYDGDKLIIYGILVFLVSFIIAAIYRMYGYRHYAECRERPCMVKSVIRPMLCYSGWDLYGNMSTIARTQGVNMLLNMFFGPVLNAAGGVASQVQGVIMGFASNVVTAVKPQIIKSYAAEEYDRTTSLLFNTSKFTFLLLLVLSFPLMAEMHYVLTLWLGFVPEHAANFCVLTLVFNFFATMSTVLVTAAHAANKVKRPSLINGSLYLLVIPISYVAFRCGISPEWSYMFNVMAVLVGMLSNAWTAFMYVPGFSFKRFFVDVFLRVMFVFLVLVIVVKGVQRLFADEGFIRLIIVSATSIVCLICLGYYVLMDKAMRANVVVQIKNKLWKKV